MLDLLSRLIHARMAFLEKGINPRLKQVVTRQMGTKGKEFPLDNLILTTGGFPLPLLPFRVETEPLLSTFESWHGE
jgi:hypothetical protein